MSERDQATSETTDRRHELATAITSRLNEIAAAVDQLQRERKILRGHATRLRLSESPLVIEAEIRAAGIELRWPGDGDWR